MRVQLNIWEKYGRELEYGHTISLGKSTPPREDCKQFGKSTGRNESTAELLVKVWEGIRKFLDVPKESTGSFFRHMRVSVKSFLYCGLG